MRLTGLAHRSVQRQSQRLTWHAPQLRTRPRPVARHVTPGLRAQRLRCPLQSPGGSAGPHRGAAAHGFQHRQHFMSNPATRLAAIGVRWILAPRHLCAPKQLTNLLARTLKQRTQQLHAAHASPRRHASRRLRASSAHQSHQHRLQLVLRVMRHQHHRRTAILRHVGDCLMSRRARTRRQRSTSLQRQRAAMHGHPKPLAHALHEVRVLRRFGSKAVVHRDQLHLPRASRSNGAHQQRQTGRVGATTGCHQHHRSSRTRFQCLMHATRQR